MYMHTHAGMHVCKLTSNTAHMHTHAYNSLTHTVTQTMCLIREPLKLVKIGSMQEYNYG